MAAQREADRILSTFQPPPGATEDARQPNPLPADLLDPPTQSAAQTQATATAWYTAAQLPDQVLAWVRANPPAGSHWSGSGSSTTGPGSEEFSYPTPQSRLSVAADSGPGGGTVIRLDASVVWTPSRAPDTKLGDNAPSVSVVTANPLNPHTTLPTNETTPLTATDPVLIRKVVDLLNALQPPRTGAMCPMDDGTRVLITLPGLAAVSADPGGCGDVTITPQGGAPQRYAGGGELITKAYALFGIIWSRTGDLPQGIERTGASGTR